jgi:hypothetical protein
MRYGATIRERMHKKYGEVMPAQPQGRPALRNGLIFGAILALLGIGNTFVQWKSGAFATTSQYSNGFTTVNVSDTGASSLLGCVVFLAMVGLTFVAGYLTARRVGRASAGAIAGLIAGIVGALVGGAVGFAVIVLLVAPGLQTPAGSGWTHTQVQAALIGTTLGGAVLGLLLDAGFGAGMGALGGLAGVNSYRTMRAGMAAFYPSMPGQPGVPPQPGAYPPPQYPPQYTPPQYPPQYTPPSGFPPHPEQ